MNIIKIMIASNNKGKIQEIASYLHDFPVELCSQDDFEIPPAEETGLSFIENAILKARHAAHHSGLPALGDDSGLAVSALDGRPGIYSARYAGIGAKDGTNIDKLLHDLKNVPLNNRQASFYCALAFVRHAADPIPIISLGEWHGSILTETVGSNGFGYDPIFWVPEMQCSAAQLNSTQKNKLSHRAKALKQWAAQFRSLYLPHDEKLNK